MPLAPGSFSKRISISNPCSKLAFKRIWKGHFPGARGIGEFLDTNCGVNHSSELSRDWSFIIYLAHAVHLFGCFWWIAQCMRRPYLRTQPQERHAECDWRQTTPPCNPEESRGFVMIFIDFHWCCLQFGSFCLRWLCQFVQKHSWVGLRRLSGYCCECLFRSGLILE